MNPSVDSHKKIGGVDFVFSKLSASRAVFELHPIAIRVISHIAQSGTNPAVLLSAFKKLGSEEMSAEESKALIDAVVSGVLSLPPDDWQTPDGRKMAGFKSLADLMIEHVKIKGPAGPLSVDVDVQFTGREPDFYKVLGEALRHNLSGFLAASLSGSAPGGPATT